METMRARGEETGHEGAWATLFVSGRALKCQLTSHRQAQNGRPRAACFLGKSYYFHIDTNFYASLLPLSMRYADTIG